MTEPITQMVTITVTEGDKEATLTREILNAWPGRPSPHITTLIREVADEIIESIHEAEADLPSVNDDFPPF